MNLEELEAELYLYVPDDRLGALFKSWINEAVYEIANDFNLPALRLKNPVSLSVTESDWLYDLPASYMKNLYKCYGSDWNEIIISSGLGNLDTLDIDHDDTGDHVTHVAVRDTQIGIYPKAAENIKLWFYEKPTDLSDLSDELVCIPKQYHSRVVISKIIIKAYHILIDISSQVPKKSLSWWRDNYHSGLFGDGSDVGMINVFARNRGVRRHGGQNPLP